MLAREKIQNDFFHNKTHLCHKASTTHTTFTLANKLCRKVYKKTFLFPLPPLLCQLFFCEALVVAAAVVVVILCGGGTLIQFRAYK
jgi:hypothetical protein